MSISWWIWSQPQPPGYGRIAHGPTELLGREVDVVTEKAFIGCYGRRILKEAVPL